MMILCVCVCGIHSVSLTHSIYFNQLSFVLFSSMLLFFSVAFDVFFILCLFGNHHQHHHHDDNDANDNDD